MDWVCLQILSPRAATTHAAGLLSTRWCAFGNRSASPPPSSLHSMWPCYRRLWPLGCSAYQKPAPPNNALLSSACGLLGAGCSVEQGKSLQHNLEQEGAAPTEGASGSGRSSAANPSWQLIVRPPPELCSPVTRRHAPGGQPAASASGAWPAQTASRTICWSFFTRARMLMSTYRSPRDRMTPPMMEGSTWGSRAEGRQQCVRHRQGNVGAGLRQPAAGVLAVTRFSRTRRRSCALQPWLSSSHAAQQLAASHPTTGGRTCRPAIISDAAPPHPTPPAATHHLLQRQLLPRLQQRLQAPLDLLNLIRAQALRQRHQPVQRQASA